MPDVVVTLEGDQLWIEVPNAIYDRLDTEAFYGAIAKPGAPRKGVSDANDLLDQATVSHAKAQGRAEQFIWAVRQRKQTLLRVAEYVCAYQEAYIRGDARGLRPLTRSELGNALGVHESTCAAARLLVGSSRCPRRKVIPMTLCVAAPSASNT